MLKLESLSDLQSLIDDGIEEGLELEYKSSPSLTREYSTGEGRELNEAAIEMGDNPEHFRTNRQRAGFLPQPWTIGITQNRESSIGSAEFGRMCGQAVVAFRRGRVNIP
jgi:hypothetical protein